MVQRPTLKLPSIFGPPGAQKHPISQPVLVAHLILAHFPSMAARIWSHSHHPPRM